VPYRIDIPDRTADALDRLTRLGALDVAETAEGLAAVMPDALEASRVARELGVDRLRVSPAVARDDGSTWVLDRHPVRAGRLLVVPADSAVPDGSIQLLDNPAFGSGLHPTTALCLEVMDGMLAEQVPDRVLDVGTGSGVLALAALALGVPHATALDIDRDALQVAEENARINGLSDRLTVMPGGPEGVEGMWPLVLANILAATLIELAPVLVRRVASGGQLVLSGIATSTAPDVERAYRRRGLHLRARAERAGWAALVFAASW
jgi:ribosomal protein L11 methyltransferase